MSIAHSIKDTVRTDDVLITESVDFRGLLLSKHVLQGLTEAGFKRPSPIQLKAIPLGRCGLDLIVQAKSGTGKTCVYTVVALEGLEVKSVCVQVLVLAPTREIAIQVQDVIQTIGKPMKGLKCHAFIGGLPLDVDKNTARNCHIAVGTPGRVKQLIEIGAMKTNNVRMFILDEADKLLEEGFQEPINWIYATLPQNKQILALSATYPEQLAQHLTSYMRNPTFVRLNTTDPALLGIKQYHYVVANHPMPNVVFSSKIDAVVKILSSVSFQQCLIFSNLQTGAQNLQSELLSRNWPTTCIAGSLAQKERNLAMEQLKTYKCRILISTDLTSRGIDADKVNLVINLDVPFDHETYLHRIGRAGRFGSFGAAVTIVTKGTQETQLWVVEKKCLTCIHKLPVPIPNDLVTKPVPLRIDDIVSTEQIITQPASEILTLAEAPSVVASNHCQEIASSSDTRTVTQLSEQTRYSSGEQIHAEAVSPRTERDTTSTDETQAELTKTELPKKHVSEIEPTVVEERNCISILEPRPLSLHEIADMFNDSHSTTEAEFRHETVAENSGKSKIGIPAENVGNCIQEVNSGTGDNDSYEVVRGSCNECKCGKSTGVCSNCSHGICPDNNLETDSGQDSGERISVVCNDEMPAVQISHGTLNDDLAVVSLKTRLEECSETRCTGLEARLEECLENRGTGVEVRLEECLETRGTGLKTRLDECLETGLLGSVSTPEYNNCLASLEIVKCEGVHFLEKSKGNILENNGSCEIQHNSITAHKKTYRDSLFNEDKLVLLTDSREESKDGVIRKDNSECKKDSNLVNSLDTLVNMLHKYEPVQWLDPHGNSSRGVTKTEPVSISVNTKAESVSPLIDSSVGGDSLISDKVLVACSETSSSTESNVKKDCNTDSCNKVVSGEVVSSLATRNAERVNIRGDQLDDSEAPAFAIPDKCNHSQSSSSEVAQAESNAKAPNRTQEKLPVKFRKTGTKRSYLKPFALSDFLQFVNESNSSHHSDDTSYPFNDPDEHCNGDDDDDDDIISLTDISISVQDSMPCDLKGGGDFVAASCVLPSGQKIACEMFPNEAVVSENKESSYQGLDVCGGGDCIALDVAGASCVDSVSCALDGLHAQSGDGDAESHKVVASLGHHVDLIQPNNAENGVFDSKSGIVNESADDSLPHPVCNSPQSAASQVSHKSTDIILMDCFSSILLSSQSSSQLPTFADLEADYKQFCSGFDDSKAVSCASELMANIVLEDFEDCTDVQELCAVESAKLALLKANLKAKLLNAEEKRKSELSLEERLTLRKGGSGDKPMNEKVGEKSEGCLDETGHKKQKTKRGYKGRNKSGKGRKGSDSLNWRNATDENYEKSACDGQHFSPRKDVDKKQKTHRNNVNLSEQLNEVSWKRVAVNKNVDNTDDQTSNQSHLPERHCDMLAERHDMLEKNKRDINKLNRDDDRDVTENAKRDGDENVKVIQVKPSDKKDDECKMLDNMHAQMMLKRKLRKLEREHPSGGDVQSCTTEVTITENTKGKDDESAEEAVEPSERRDEGCKVLDNMHEQMLLNRKLKKLERKLQSSGEVRSNSGAAEVAELNQELKFAETVDKGTGDFNASTHTEKAAAFKGRNILQDIDSSVILEAVSTKENSISVCKENQKQRSDPEIKKEDKGQVPENMSGNTSLSEQSKQKSTERERLVKFKPAVYSQTSYRKPTKPSKTEARLAGLEVSDGSTSSTTDLSLSSASDISDVNSSDMDTKDVILSSQCYANKYAQEGYIDPRWGKPNKKEVTKKASSHPAFCPCDDNLQYSTSLPETEHLQHGNYPSKGSLALSMSPMSLPDSHSAVFLPGNQHVYHPYPMDYPVTDHPLPGKYNSKGKKCQNILAEQNNKFHHEHKSNSSGRKHSEQTRENTLAKDHKLSRRSRQNHEVVRQGDEFKVSDSEDSSSDSSQSDSHSFIPHHPNLYSYNATPWFPSYSNMHQSVQQPACPTSPYGHAVQPQTVPHYCGPQTIHPFYPYPAFCQNRQPPVCTYPHQAFYQNRQPPACNYQHPAFYQNQQPSACSYPQPVFQWHTTCSQTMWYYVSHMTSMLTHLMKKHRREMESMSGEE